MKPRHTLKTRQVATQRKPAEKIFHLKLLVQIGDIT